MPLCAKGDKRQTIGLHYVVAGRTGKYVRKGEINRGPLFRPRVRPHGKRLANRHLTPKAMYELIMVTPSSFPVRYTRAWTRTGPQSPSAT